MDRRLELLVDEQDGCIRLLSPEVGSFTCCVPAGGLLSAGASAGAVRLLGQTIELIVPTGITGRVSSARPERVNAPVGYGDVLYELSPLQNIDDPDAGTAASDSESATSAPLFKTPYSGRFWHRSAPGAPPFVEAGARVEPGTIVGLIEVMKTFTHLTYQATGNLPEKGRVVKILVDDGAEVTEGDALIEMRE